jgi:hypothetical protein
MSATNGGGIVKVTNDPSVYKLYNGVTFSADGTTTAFVGTAPPSGTLSVQGLYRSPVIGGSGASTEIVTDPVILAGVYWTSTNGRSRSGVTAFLARKRHKGLLP